MGDTRTYYEILQVSHDASAEVIHSSYRTLMTKLGKHPDLGGDTDEAAVINHAYETLADPAKRAAYDATLRLSRERAGGSKPDFVEKRRAPRKDVDATVSFCVSHNSTWHPARVKDASVLGLRIKSHAPLAVGEHLVIAPPNLASPALHGTVRWSRMYHPSIFERVYEAGIEFADQISDIDSRLET